MHTKETKREMESVEKNEIVTRSTPPSHAERKCDYLSLHTVRARKETVRGLYRASPRVERNRLVCAEIYDSFKTCSRNLWDGVVSDDTGTTSDPEP
jgi:hypothetical protein